MQTSHILALSLTHHSLSAGYTYMSAAYRSVLEASSTRFDLGLEHLSSCSKASEIDRCTAHYWAQIHDVITRIGRTALRPLTTLLLLGEDAQNSDFVHTVQEALRELLPDASAEEIAAMVRVLGEREVGSDGDIAGSGSQKWDPLYVAARGAAEFAKRAQEAPAGCKEPARCAENSIPAENEGGINEQAPLKLEVDGGKAELKT